MTEPTEPKEIPPPPELPQDAPGVSEPSNAGSKEPADSPPIYPDDYAIKPVEPKKAEAKPEAKPKAEPKPPEPKKTAPKKED